MNKDDCIFCKIAKEGKDFIYESDNFFAVNDINPLCKGHTLIIPKKHFTTMIDLPVTLGSELLETIKRVAEIRFKEGAEGFNLVVNVGEASGQVVKHVHLHLIPRKKGDKVNFKC